MSASILKLPDWDKFQELINTYVQAVFLTEQTLQGSMVAIVNKAKEIFKECKEKYTKDEFVQVAREYYCECLIIVRNLAPPKVPTCIYKNVLILIKLGTAGYCE